jgi:hypothetical protein
MSPHSDTLSWFRADQFLLFLLNAACLPEKQQISICIYIVFGMTQPGLKPMIYHTRGEHSNHYATDAVRIIRSCMDAAETHIHVIKGTTI